MTKKGRTIIDLLSLPRVYRPEPVQRRLEREHQRIAKQDGELFKMIAEAKNFIYDNKKKRE